MSALATGELDMAIVQNDIAFYAFRGTGVSSFEGKANNKVRAMGVLYPEVLHIVARKDALKGMKITWQPSAMRHFTAKFAPL